MLEINVFQETIAQYLPAIEQQSAPEDTAAFTVELWVETMAVVRLGASRNSYKIARWNPDMQRVEWMTGKITREQAIRSINNEDLNLNGGLEWEFGSYMSRPSWVCEGQPESPKYVEMGDKIYINDAPQPNRAALAQVYGQGWF